MTSKASAKNSSKLNKFLHSEVNLLIQQKNQSFQPALWLSLPVGETNLMQAGAARGVVGRWKAGGAECD